MATEKKSTVDTDARIRRTGPEEDPNRQGRGVTADEQREQLNGTTFSAADTLRLIRDEFRQEALPSPPEIPGWHTCWLSTTSTYDPISKRQRLGYVPVAPEELRGFKVEKAGSGEFQGAVTCNEMVLFKIPQEVYEMIMREFHHDQPLREEERLRDQLRGPVVSNSRGEHVDSDADVEGFEDLALKRAAPHFT